MASAARSARTSARSVARRRRYTSAAVVVYQSLRSAELMASHVVTASKSRANAMRDALPPERRSVAASSRERSSRASERTYDVCTPSPRCSPAQLMHSAQPSERLAHVGRGVLQSMHTSLPGMRKKAAAPPSSSLMLTLTLMRSTMSSSRAGPPGRPPTGTLTDGPAEHGTSARCPVPVVRFCTMDI